MRERFYRLRGFFAALLLLVGVVLAVAGCGNTSVAGVGVSAESMAAIWPTETAVSPETTAARETAASQTRPTETTAVPETTAAVRPTETTKAPETTTSQPPKSQTTEFAVTEDGSYITRDEVALYLHIFGKLPGNFITKNEAEDLGWKKKDGRAGQLDVVAPGKSIGGSRFGNYEGLLPEKKGRKYYECDINYTGGSRGAERIVYSSDGLIFYTGDHYQTFEQLYPVP